MPTTIDEIIESATNGVLRALEARAGAQGLDAATLVRSGFFVVVHIRAGGTPAQLISQPQVALNPQPLPPG